MKKMLPESALARDERFVRDVGYGQLVRQSLGVGEANAFTIARDLDALALEALRPEVERGVRRDAPVDPVHHSGAGASAHGPRIFEEREVEAGVALLVAVEEVVDGRVVLVDRLLDEAQTEDACVEVDVGARVACDRGDVVDAFELHCTPPRASSPRVESWAV